MGKLVRNGIDYTTPTVDGRLDENSTHSVQNKVVTQALNEKANLLLLGGLNFARISPTDYADLSQTSATTIYFIDPVLDSSSGNPSIYIGSQWICGDVVSGG